MDIFRHALGRCKPNVTAVQIADEHQQHHDRRDKTVELADKCLFTPPPFLFCCILRTVLFMDSFRALNACDGFFVCDWVGHVLRVAASATTVNEVSQEKGRTTPSSDVIKLENPNSSTTAGCDCRRHGEPGHCLLCTLVLKIIGVNCGTRPLITNGHPVLTSRIPTGAGLPRLLLYKTAI